MKCTLLLFAFLSLTVNPVVGLQIDQPDLSEEVESVIKTLFDGMREADGDAFRSVVADDVIFQRVTNREGKVELSSSDMERFIETVEQSEPGSLDEQLTSMTIKTDGDLATAWMNYSFYYNGEFSHCGVNSMNLLKTESGWKIC